MFLKTRQLICFRLIIFFISILFTVNSFANPVKKNREVLNQAGGSLKSFEHKYGPSKFDFDNMKLYEIGDCEFTAFVDNKNDIKYITLKISKNCDVVPKYSELSAVSKLKMKDFFGPHDIGRFLKPSCLDCGNSVDPTIIYHNEGDHAHDFISRILITEIPYAFSEVVYKDVGSEKAINRQYEIEKYETLLKKISSSQKIIEYGEGYLLQDEDIKQ